MVSVCIPMIVREMEMADIPEVIRLGAMMHEESAYHTLDLHPEKIAASCIDVMHRDDMLALVAYQHGGLVGMFGGYMTAPLFSRDLVAWDILCYVHPRHRGSRAFWQMAKRYVEWARGRAKLVFLTTSTGITAARTADIYQRLGFQQVGGVFRLEV